MRNTTLGELITGLVDMYERHYADHELATMKVALVVGELLRVRAGEVGGEVRERGEPRAAARAKRPVRRASARAREVSTRGLARSARRTGVLR